MLPSQTNWAEIMNANIAEIQVVGSNPFSHCPFLHTRGNASFCYACLHPLKTKLWVQKWTFACSSTHKKAVSLCEAPAEDVPRKVNLNTFFCLCRSFCINKSNAIASSYWYFTNSFTSACAHISRVVLTTIFLLLSFFSSQSQKNSFSTLM